MNNRKSLFLCILAGIMSCTYSMTASAGSFVNGGQLKNGLLLMEKDNGNYHIADYNTNDDNVVNVLDLCRVKSGLFTKDQPEKQNIYISSAGPWISDDQSKITVPVRITGNVVGVSAVTFRVAYNSWFFTMTDAYSSNNAKVSFSKGSDLVQYTAPGGRNLSSEGYFLYLVFDVASSVPAGKYDIELDDIQAAMKTADGKVKEISKEECNIDDRLTFDFAREEIITTTVTEPEVTTVETTITTVPETTTAPVTTVTKAETKPEPPKSDELSFYMDNAELSSDGRKLKVPVYMNGNKEGICNLNTIVKFDKNKFALTGIERGEYEGWGYITGNGDNAVFNTNNNTNIAANSGVIAYLNFDVRDGADQNTYSFELTDIKAAKSENWNQKNIDKCKKNSESYEFKFNVNVPATTTAKPEETTVTTTVTTPKPAETTTVTTVTEPPESIVTEPINYNADKTSEELELLNIILDYRKSLGLSDLQASDLLFECCDIRAEELTRLYSLDRPDGSSRADLLKEKGSDGWFGSCEMYTKGTNDPSAVLSRMKSLVKANPGKYVSNSDYKYIGVGYYNGYWSIILTE